MQVERDLKGLLFNDSGARVSIAWITYLFAWDNSSKDVLIPNKLFESLLLKRKAGQLAQKDRSAFHQLVGEVTAYQGYDG